MLTGGGFPYKQFITAPIYQPNNKKTTMNHLYKKLSFIACLALSGLASSCIYEDEVPCACNVRFVYDYNMEFADAFATQVNDVKLFIFDASGTFVGMQSDRGDHLDADYRMPLQLVPGTYRLVAWAGTETAPGQYTLPTLVPGQSTLQDLKLRLNTLQGVSQKNLAHLWHGSLKEFTVSGSSHAEAVVSLVKDTNKFRVLLQTGDEEALNANDFSFTIHAANGELDFDNLPAGHATAVSYLPHLKQTVSLDDEAGSDPSGTRAETAASPTAVVAELATLRLTADDDTRFTVKNERNGNTLIDIDLVHYLNLMKLDEHSDMSLQEYLDRESTWQVILFLSQQHGSYVVMAIQINAWRMIFNQTEL